MCMYLYMYMYRCVDVYMCICVYVYMCTCVCVYMSNRQYTRVPGTKRRNAVRYTNHAKSPKSDRSAKRCPLSPRLKCDYIAAEAPKSDTFVFSCAKTRKSDSTPPHLSMARDYIRSIDERSYVYMRYMYRCLYV